MKDRMSIIEKAMRSKQIVFTITTALLLLGVFALFNMPRQEFPTFTIRQGLVIGVFPGATSAQVEEQLTSKVENYLFQYKQVDRKKTYSISKEGMMIIFVEVNENVSDPEAFWSKIRHGLNELKGTLPPEVLALIADNDFGDTSALLLTLESDTKTYKQLENYLDAFENDIRKVKTVSKIKHMGLQKEQVSVYIDDAKLRHYAIKPLTVLLSLKPENSVAYAGEIDNGKIVMPLHVPSRYKTENDVAQQIIYSDPMGNVIRVKDVAKVVREYEDPDSYIRVNGKKSLIISLEMQTGNNIVQFGEEIDEVIEKFSKTLPGDVKISKIANMPEIVDTAISDFLKEFLIAIISVMFVTVILLPRRVAIVAASTIPISILITLGILYICGIDLQTVSLAGLIVVLGMVVDNAIVIIDNYVEKLDHGVSRWEAAIQSVKDLFISVFTATLAIIATYIPFLFFLRGTTKDFAWSLPITVAIALTVSLIVAAILVPILNYRYIKHGIKGDRKNDKPTFLDRLQNLYDSLIEKAFKHQKMVVIIGIASVVLGVVFAVFLQRQLFPKVVRNQFAVEIYLPTGSSLDQTEKVVKEVEGNLLQDKRVKTVASFVGTSSPRFHTVYAPNMPAKSYAQMIVNTETDDDANTLLDEYSKKYTDFYPEAHIRWRQLDMLGTKAPIEVRLSGDSIKVLKKAAAQVADVIRKYDEVNWVRYDYEDPRQGIMVDVKEDEANRLGYSKSFLGYSLAIGTQGFPVSTIWEGDYPVDVVLKVDKNKKTAYEDIKNLYVTSPFLISSTPVRQLADLKPEWTEGEIVRRNGVRTLTVRADVAREFFPSNVFLELKPEIEKINLPEGVKMEFGGEFEEEITNYIPMSYALITAIIAIFIILLFQFKTVKTALLIMMTVPLCAFGAAFGLLITGYPFGFTAFLGIISLTGIVVRNGIILVDYAEQLRREHSHSLEEAAMASAKRRMRPIFLTSAAAAVGVISMIVGGSPLWGPLGTVIAFGLIFSMILTLFVLPVLYMKFNKSSFLTVKESDIQ